MSGAADLARTSAPDHYAHGQLLLQVLMVFVDGGSYTNQFLAEELKLDTHTASKAVWAARKSGYLERGTSATSVVTHHITAKGRARIAELRGESDGLDMDAIHRKHDRVIDMSCVKVGDTTGTISFPMPSADWGKVHSISHGAPDDGDAFLATLDTKTGQLLLTWGGVTTFMPASQVPRLLQSIDSLRAKGLLPGPGAQL